METLPIGASSPLSHHRHIILVHVAHPLGYVRRANLLDVVQHFAPHFLQFPYCGDAVFTLRLFREEAVKPRNLLLASLDGLRFQIRGHDFALIHVHFPSPCVMPPCQHDYTKNSAGLSRILRYAHDNFYQDRFSIFPHCRCIDDVDDARSRKIQYKDFLATAS